MRSPRPAGLLCIAIGLLALAPAHVAAQERPLPRRPRIEVQRDTLRREPRPQLPPPAAPQDSVSAPADSAAAAVAPPAAAAAEPRAGTPVTSPDSLMAELARLEGYTVTRYSGTAATFEADSGDVTLAGPARIEREGQSIEADSLLTFDRTSSVICGYGSPVLSGEGSPIASDQICYDTEQRLGMAMGARTEFAQGATWYVHGERVFTQQSDRIYSAGTQFTTCDLEVPHYHFQASSFKMVNEQILVARDVTLHFGEVPVFWLPFLVQSLREGRRSGMLTPSLGLTDIVQTSSGHTREVRNVGFFWAINDYMGTEAALDWRAGDWVALRGRFDYRWTRQFLEGYVNARQYFREDGSRELALRSSNGWQPGERTQLHADAAYVTSSEFVRRDSYDPAELNRTLQSNAFIQHRFRSGGSVSFGADRTQQLLDDQVTMTLPRLTFSLPAITLASAVIDGTPTELTWQLSSNYSNRIDDRDELASGAASARDTRAQSASVSSGLRFGNLSWSQSINGNENRLEEKPEVTIDTTTFDALPLATTRTLNWTSSLSYQQNLIGSLRVTPSLSLGGEVQESPLTGNEPVTSPVTLNFGVGLNAEIFGFWPGVGPFERFRHKISPSISYRFRPEPDQSALQDSIFGATTRATNAIEISFQQTFEAKRPAEEARDSAGNPAADDLVGAAGEPRRLPGQQPISLLRLSTSAIAYDFEAASRGEEGLTTTQITNSISSDLLKNLTLTVNHSLFDESATDPDGDRHFDLHLEQMSARFGLTGESWLFRVLGLGGESRRETSQEVAVDTLDAADALMPESESGLMPDERPSTGTRGMGSLGSTGTWRADFDYSLRRPRDPALQGHQQISATFAFQPTENWSAGWRTAYSITDSEFLDHTITLSRSLHRWTADFSIRRAQNGNFAFEFEARLTDLPDLRVPYDQRSRGDND